MQQRLGHYRVVEQIGSGGMGVVYRARDEHLERDVAIKVLTPDSLADDDARRRFRREALALSRLNHPNIATIHDFETFEGTDVLVMEHIPGSSLDELTAQGPLPEREVLRLGLQLTAALEAAHDRGVIHRDLKPGNVRVTEDGRLKVLDFGLARALHLDAEDNTRSVTGPIFAGTLPYMAPEQLKGEDIDPRTDIYAAGAVLYELATGTPLHPGLSGARLLGAILDGHPDPARARNPRISAGLENLLARALDRDPERRYQSARELRVDLERLAMGAAPASPPLGRRRPAAIAAGILGVVLLTGWMAYRSWPRTATPLTQSAMLIADFVVRGSDSGLGDAFRAGLTVQLQQSPAWNVVAREQIFDALKRMQRAPDALDVDTLRELCVRENIPVLLAGTIQRLGDVTRVDVRAIQAADAEVLFNEHVQFREEGEAFDSIDRLARTVRRRLGEPDARIQEHDAPLARVTTRSLEALKQYSRATDLFARGEADASLAYLRAALGLDPDFAMAHRLIARVYETLGNRVKEREHLARAYELRASLSERERRHVEASVLRAQQKYEQAVETLRALVTLYPADGEAHYELAISYRDAGNLDRAIRELETTVAQSPYVTPAFGQLLLLLTRTSDYARAREVHDEARRRGIEGSQVIWGRAMLLLGEGRTADARQALQELQGEAVYGNAARLYQTTIDLYEGKLSQARERLEKDILLDQRDRNTVAELTRRDLLARIALVAGDLREAQRQAAAVLDRDPESVGVSLLRRAASVLVQARDLERVRQLVARLEAARAAVDSAFARSCYYAAVGELALGQGRPEAAIDAFSRAEAEYWRPAITRGLARSYEAAGDWPSARAQWVRLLASRGEIFYEGFAPDWVLAHLDLARVEQRASNPEGARHQLQIFLELWKNGDDLPVRRAAAKEAAGLADRTTPAGTAR